jgi:hypothetical protein
VAVLSNVPAYEYCKAPGIISLLDTIGTGLRSVTMPGFLLSQTIAHLNETGREAARDAALSALPGLSLGVTALAHLSRWSRWSLRPRRPGRGAAPAAGLGLPPGGHAGALSEWGARELLEPAGVPFVPAALARTPDEAASFAADFASPVAVKLVSPDVPHKSDIGAVRLGVAGPDDVRLAYRDVLTAGHTNHEGLRVEGVQISPMRRGGVELLVGVTRDPQWGLAIAVGLGGIFAEAVADVAVRLLPVTGSDIEEMLTELRGSAVLAGIRGEPAVDRSALVSAIARIADAAWWLGDTLGDALESLEVNPLRADHSGAEALDALVVFGGTR